MENKNLQMKLHYLLRGKLYQTMMEDSKVLETANNIVAKLYRSFSLTLMKSFEDALSVLTTLHKDPVGNLSSILATVHIYKNSGIGSSEDLLQLETSLRNERKKANDISLYFAALFLHSVDRDEKAREYADRMLNLNPNHLDGLVLRGWIEMSMEEKHRKKNPLEYFENALKNDATSAEAILGKISYLIKIGSISEALTAINSAIFMFPKNQEFVFEKLYASLAIKDWDAVSELTKKIDTSSSLNIKVLAVQIIATICHDGSFVDATPLLKRLFSILEKFEPLNGELFFDTAKLFSRVCGRHLPILNDCQVFVEKAVGLDEKNLSYITELAHLQLLQGRPTDALVTLKNASKLGEIPTETILLKIHCMIEDGHYEDAEQQLNILEELHENVGSCPNFLFVKTLILRQKPNQKIQLLELLSKAHQLQVANADTITYGIDYLIELNPDFLLSIAEEYVLCNPEDSTLIQKELVTVLSSVVDACPGLLPALYRLANAHFMAGDFRAATSTLHHIVDHVDPTFIEAYLLLASIGLKQQNNISQAAQYLELGLSYNFQVRDHPLYHLLLARVQRLRKEHDAALTSLRTCMILSGMRPPTSVTKRSKLSLNQEDQATAYLELFHVFMSTGKKEEAGQVLDEALRELQGSPQEGLVLLAQVDYLLDEGDIDGALKQLKSLPNSHPQYLKSREKMASVYLNKLHDEQLYLTCYREIARQQPTVHNMTLLGDAHFALHQVEQALNAYEEALKVEPRNALLASKIGRALVLTHQYTKAVNYYKDALRDPSSGSQNVLRHEYASLLMRLGHLDKAEKVISESLWPANQPLPKDSDLIAQEIQNLLLLSQLQEEGGKRSSEATLRKAQGLVGSLLKRVSSDQPELVAQHKKIAASIATRMAGYAVAHRDTEAAVALYREALSYLPDSIECMAQLARVYLLADDVEHCQHICKSLLKIDRHNEHAMIMVAQIALRKNDLETAALHFRQALEHQPGNFEALSQFIDVCRRRGTVEDAAAGLQSADRGQNEAGLSYCQGLFQYYSGQHNAALLALNRARGHPVWGQKAIRHMLDLCLNGEHEMLENLTDIDSHYEVQDTELMALHTAAKLLLELKPLEGDTLQTHILYPHFYLIATRQKFNVERAMMELTACAGKSLSPDSPGVIFGIASAHILLKQNQKARNQLKRVMKSLWTLDEGNYLEKCWLLLADIYIQAGKLEVANDLLRRVLTYNRSCAKAYEYLGFIMEKEQSYREAAAYFDNAWTISNKTSSAVGFKLAQCYLKAKQYTDAIDVGQALLIKYPEHPRVRKDVLDKAMSLLRT